jgi:hypothetical protein
MRVATWRQADERGSQVPTASACAASGAGYAVELYAVPPVIRADRPPTVEMSDLWKSQTDFHRSLEISHRPRDSHISTADPLGVFQEEQDTSAHASRAPTEAR